MTKYKEYLRTHVPLACDYEVLPCEGVEAVWTDVLDHGIVATTYINATESWSIMYNKRGEGVVFKSYDDLADLFGTCYDFAYITWLCDKGYTSSEEVLDIMRFMYCNDAEVRMAFKHMSAGIMDEAVFHRWLDKRYLRYMSIL